MSKFFKKHYKKFLIFCSLFILGFIFLFTKPNKVNAVSIPSEPSLPLFINGPSYFWLISRDTVCVDLPNITNTNTFQYNLDSSTGTIPFTQHFISSTEDVSLIQISFPYLGQYGTTGLYFESFVYFPNLNFQGLDYNFVYFIALDSTDTYQATINFDYVYFNASSNSFSRDTYSSSVQGIEQANGGYAFFPFASFNSDFVLNYSLYYFENVRFTINTDNGNTLESSYICPSSSDVYKFSFMNFIQTNSFDFGVSDSQAADIYNQGFNAGVESVNPQHYYDEGYTHASEDFLKFENLVFSVMNGFTNTIESLLDFEIFGISVFGLIGGLVACAFGIGITILIIKAIKIFT